MFLEYKILNVHKIYTFKTGSTMFKVSLECVPSIFSKLFTFYRDIHSYKTRQSKKLHVQIARTNYMLRCTSVQKLLTF